MRGKKAKNIRNIVYRGGFSSRTREYTKKGEQIVNTGRRKRYLEEKKKFKKNT